MIRIVLLYSTSDRLILSNIERKLKESNGIKPGYKGHLVPDDGCVCGIYESEHVQ